MANVNTGDKWEYYFETAKIGSKRKRISKGGFFLKSEAYNAGVKAYNEYNNAGFHFVPSEISFSDYLDYWMKEWENIILRFPEGHSCHIPLMLGYHCGLRLGEAFALTWDDINFDNNTISINKQVQMINDHWTFTNPKYDSFRVIKCDSILLSLLYKEKEKQLRAKEYYAEHYKEIYIPDKRSSEYKQNDSQPVWMVNSREDGSYIQPRVTQHLGRIIHYQLGYSKFDFHSLRTTHTTMLIESGANPKAVQIRLGHKNIQTTMNIYAKCTNKMQDDAIDILERILK